MANEDYRGTGWTVGNIFSVLKRMGLSPHAVQGEPDEPLQLIALKDPVSTLNFGCLYDPDSVERLRHLAMVCVIPAPHMTEDEAEQINARLPVAAAFLERGALWIYAELNTSMNFSEAFFTAQVEFYITDMRTALQLLAAGSRMSMEPAEIMVGIARRRGAKAPMVRALANVEGTARALETKSSAQQKTHSSRSVCPKCNGSGKGFLGRCRACHGTGLARG